MRIILNVADVNVVRSRFNASDKIVKLARAAALDHRHRKVRARAELRRHQQAGPSAANDYCVDLWQILHLVNSALRSKRLSFRGPPLPEESASQFSGNSRSLGPRGDLRMTATKTSRARLFPLRHAFRLLFARTHRLRHNLAQAHRLGPEGFAIVLVDIVDVTHARPREADQWPAHHVPAAAVNVVAEHAFGRVAACHREKYGIFDLLQLFVLLRGCERVEAGELLQPRAVNV